MLPSCSPLRPPSLSSHPSPPPQNNGRRAHCHSKRTQSWPSPQNRTRKGVRLVRYRNCGEAWELGLQCICTSNNVCCGHATQLTSTNKSPNYQTNATTTNKPAKTANGAPPTLVKVSGPHLLFSAGTGPLLSSGTRSEQVYLDTQFLHDAKQCAKQGRCQGPCTLALRANESIVYRELSERGIVGVHGKCTHPSHNAPC